MKSAMLIVLWVNILIGTRVFGIESGDICADGLAMHTDKDGMSRCCLNIACSEGRPILL